jgi:hypothetical protein
VLPVPTILLFADGLVLGLLVAFAPAGIALFATLPAGLLAAVACELLARKAMRDQAGLEPWRLDGWSVVVATLGVLGLTASLGAEAIGVAWLMVALFVGLGFASLPNLAPRPRP